MNDFFIRRPVATFLLTWAIALAGWLGFESLPVSPLPQVDFPTISVQAGLPGASPEVMAASVATPLERALGRIAGVTEMTSQSSTGSTRITLQFDLSREIDGAARDVQAAIHASRSLLPTMPSPPTYRKVNPSDSPAMVVALSSLTLSRGALYDLATTVLAQRINQVEGVGQVDIGGASLPAVRIAFNVPKLNQYGISPEQVRRAITTANANRPKGFIEDQSRHWALGVNDTLYRAEEYRTIYVAPNVRLSDVARVEDSVQDVRNAGMANDSPSVLLLIRRQPGANVIEMVERVKALLPQLQKTVPADVTLKVMIDATRTIRGSLKEVELTLGLSILLIVIVVFAFLRSWRATLIPAIVIPVSLLGTCAFLYVCGYSLNNLSLMALIIAAGFVVDDAVVVVESISRHIERGKTAYQAAVDGLREVVFTVVSMSVSLVAVFIPILFMGGLMGRLFREFAMTLAIAIVVSMFVSLIVTPMMCAKWLKTHEHNAKQSRLSLWAEKIFQRTEHAYAVSLRVALRYWWVTAFVCVATLVLNIYLYMNVKKGFMPQQDTGRLMGSIRADQGLSFVVMEEKLGRLIKIVRSDPAVEGVVGFVGGGQSRAGGTLFVALKPFAQRKEAAPQIIARLRGKTARESGVQLMFQAVQDIRIGARPSSAQYQYTLEADSLELLREWSGRIQQALARQEALKDLNSDQEDRATQTFLEVDRDKAARFGVDMNMISATLNDLFGQRQVSVLYQAMNQYRVVMEADSAYREDASALEGVWVTGRDARLVPLSAIASWRAEKAPLSVNRQSGFVASTLSFNLAEGKALSDAEQIMQEVWKRLQVPASVRGSFQGTAKAFQASTSSQPLLILAALIVIYLVLGILYESVWHPFTILSTLPSAGVGALLAVMLKGDEFNLMTLIGVILLMGLVKKNAIMVIDVAIEAQKVKNVSSREAIFEACIMRFRPIMMTTFAAFFGAIPLAFGSGEGAELRQPLGVALMGGLILSQIVTLYTTPVVYLGIEKIRRFIAKMMKSTNGSDRHMIDQKR